MYDLHNDISVASSIRSQAVTEAVNGTGVALAGYNSAVILVNVGTFAGTTPAATVEVQESADDKTYTAVAAADLYGDSIPEIETTTDATLYELGYKGTKSYVRVAVTEITGDGASLPLDAVIVRGHPSTKPAQ